MKISKITKKDFAKWMELGVLFWSRHPKEKTEREFRRIINSKNEVSFVCKNEHESFLGFINLAIRTDYVEGSKTSPVGYLEGIYVKEAYRKKGVAKMLWQEAEKWLIKKGVSEIGSDTGTDNVASQKFHQKMGFKKGETLIHYLKKI